MWAVLAPSGNAELPFVADHDTRYVSEIKTEG